MFTWCENKSFSFFFQFGGKVNGRLIIDVAMVDPFYGLWVFVKHPFINRAMGFWLFYKVPWIG